MNYKSYAGIGSRNTPPEIMEIMTQIATKLEEKGWTLRSGAAQGADAAFEKGVESDKMKEIYLPWKNFHNSKSKYYDFEYKLEAERIARKFHKGFEHLSDGAKKLMTRNTYQILGNKLKEPSKFVICWTPDGCESDKTRKKITGGTGQAISIADSLDIPVFNLANKSSYDRLIKFIS